ncbi:MAG: hypothetical protein ABI813_15405 [Bacteroidota bacterium]
MPEKITILNNLRGIVLLLLVFVCNLYGLAAQPGAPLQVTGIDSIALLNQLLKGNLLRYFPDYKRQYLQVDSMLTNPMLADGLGRIVLSNIRQLKKVNNETGETVLLHTMDAGKKLLQPSLDAILHTGGAKKMAGQFAGLVKQPLFQWFGGALQLTGQTVPCLNSKGQALANNIVLDGNWRAMGIPMALQFSRQDYTGPVHSHRNVISFRFNREDYLNSLRDKIRSQTAMVHIALAPAYNELLKKMKEAMQAELHASLDSINNIYKGVLSNTLEKLGDATNLLKEQGSLWEQKLRSIEEGQVINYKKNLLAQMQQELNAGGTINTVLFDSLLLSVQKAEGVDKIINQLRSFKKNFQKTGLLQKIEQAEQIQNDHVQEWLQDPDKIKSLAKEALDLNGIQKFFLNMSQLSMGLNTVSLSPLTVYQYSIQGISAAFFNNKTYLFVMAGKQAGSENRLGGPLPIPLTYSGTSIMGLRAGKGDISGLHTHVSLFSYRQDKANDNSGVYNTVPSHTLVAGFSQQIKLNENNSLGIELSKSAHTYKIDQSIADTLSGSDLAKQFVNGDDFLQQMAIALQWHGELKDRAFSYDLHGSKIGEAYNNPGNPFLSSGTLELGGSGKKAFLKNRLLVSAKADYHEYRFNSNSTKWCNYHFSFREKWKLKGGQYISLQYQPYCAVRFQGNAKYSVMSGNSLSLEGNFRKRFGAFSYQHTASLSILKSHFRPDSLSSGGTAFLLSSIQTITINSKSYYLNLQYNKTGSPVLMPTISTQLNADAGLSYSICKGVLVSTALTYNYTREWFQQFGIKQTISGAIGERFTVSVFAVIAKNIKTYRDNNIENTRIDWSLQYLLK